MHAAPPTTTPAALDVRPLTASIGATVHDLELRHASDDQVAAVRSAVLRHRIVFFRGQSLDDEGDHGGSDGHGADALLVPARRVHPTRAYGRSGRPASTGRPIRDSTG